VRHREEDLKRTFFSSSFSRTPDVLAYARFRPWSVYGQEGLTGREATLWMAARESLTLERRGQQLSRYEVWVEAASAELREDRGGISCVGTATTSARRVSARTRRTGP
jgi:hypothetical protein